MVIIDKSYIIRQFYKVDGVLIFINIFVLFLWLLYLTNQLIKSNKILRGTKRHESASETQYSVYNARTQVIKNRFLIGILVIEIATAILPAVSFHVFARHEVVWNVGERYIDGVNSSSNSSNSCIVDYRSIAVYHFPTFLLLPALSSVSFLLLLTLLSIHTYFLEMRYKICHYRRGALKLAALGIAQSIFLIALCFSRFTVLFGPLFFVGFLLYDFIVYVQLVRRLKLTLRGRLLEIYTFEDCALKFENEQRLHRKYNLFTFLFCFAILVPCVVFHLDLLIFLFSYNPGCVLNIFFSLENKMHLVTYKKVTEPIVNQLLHLNPIVILVPICFLLLPHFVFMVSWQVDRINRRKRFARKNADITEKLI